MRKGVAGLGLGEIRGDHGVIGPVMGSMALVLRECLVVLWIVLLVAAVIDPDEFIVKATVMTALVAAVYALTFGWRRLTARLGVNRCYLCAHGVAVTDRFGRIRDSVAWSEVTGVQQLTAVDFVAGFHRIEISRNRSAEPLWFVAPGLGSALVRALLDEGRRNGALQ
ncbi:hypothetical protein [Thermomonospora umbrina]|uniref:Uncharacterized protein n=1 Tax=Thermomonospora umbrina TaxID=111806 RepID=A0A3D9SWK4_9ACTN|nr:hypothetical protein [Thermomonospora umbrina]REE99977.1 hypothetical protein DFJ69_5497 [Thermomonospora umbrina]